MLDSPMAPERPARNHVFIVDGTLSRLEPGRRTHAGRLRKLLLEVGPSARQSVAYHAGVQGKGWRRWAHAALGIGINDAIKTGYGVLSNRYRPGDHIFLFGFSRGAYAVRSLAGLIERIGLLQAEHATERRVERAFRYYEADALSPSADAFRTSYCHQNARIACIGVWDTVKALGLPYPVLSRIFPMATEFHDHHLPKCADAAFQALALDEDRTAYAPILWEDTKNWPGQLEQAWFPGCHSDVGGGRECFEDARPLGNINLRWMLRRAEANGLVLPAGWEDRLVCSPSAPAVGSRRGVHKLFLLRKPRRIQIGQDGQKLHSSVAQRMAALPTYRPRPDTAAEPQVQAAE